MNTLNRFAAIAFSAAMLGATSTSPARAEYIATLTQQGSAVVATGSGSLNLTGLPFFANLSLGALLVPSSGLFVLGPAQGSADTTSLYDGITGPPSFGGGSVQFASFGAGDGVGISGGRGGSGSLFVPVGYVSGTPLNSTDTYAIIFDFSTGEFVNATFANLGVRQGTYVYTLGTGGNADSFELIVGSGVSSGAVPEPAAGLLLGIGLAFTLTAARCRPRRPD